MTEPTPTPRQNLPAPDSEETNPDPVDDEETLPKGFFNRVQRSLKPHPTEAEEIVVDLTPIKRTHFDEET